MNRLYFCFVVFVSILVGCGKHGNSHKDDYSTKTSPFYDNYNNNGYYHNNINPFSSSSTNPSNYSGYKYNYKYNDYYNYDVSGYDADGNYVNGNVDIDESGDGYIYDENGNEKYIEVEWTDWGVMEGYDEDGNYYELEVE